MNSVDVFVEMSGKQKKSDETVLESQLVDLLSGLSGGEYIYFDAMPHPLELARNGHDQERMGLATRERFRPVIEGFARSILGATEVILVASKGKEPPKWSIKTKMHSDKIQETLRLLGGIDGVFCGAAIVVTREVEPQKGDF